MTVYGCVGVTIFASAILIGGLMEQRPVPPTSAPAGTTALDEADFEPLRSELLTFADDAHGPEGAAESAPRWDDDIDPADRSARVEAAQALLRPGQELYAALRSRAAEHVIDGDLEAAAEVYERILETAIPLEEATTGHRQSLHRRQVGINLSDIYTALGTQDDLARAYELRQGITIDPDAPDAEDLHLWKLYGDAQYLGGLGDRSGFDALIAAFPEDRIRYRIMAIDTLWLAAIDRIADAYDVDPAMIRVASVRSAAGLREADLRRLEREDDARLSEFQALFEEAIRRPDVHTLRVAAKLVNILRGQAGFVQDEAARTALIDASVDYAQRALRCDVADQDPRTSRLLDLLTRHVRECAVTFDRPAPASATVQPATLPPND